MDGLVAAAAAVLRRNDVGGRYTRPAAGLYPHQWSWDSAITAVGWAHVDLPRAAAELRTLFGAQWADGRVPHIVFHDPEEDGYFPGPARWRCDDLDGTPDVATSGLIQPAVHATAARRILAGSEAAGDPTGRDLLDDLYPALLRWHAYLHDRRDRGSGRITIVHPWESGTDNSPRWDAPLAAVTPSPRPVYERRDLSHTDDRAQRPTDADYDRYVWLLDRLAEQRWDDDAIGAGHDFQVEDVLHTAILVRADRDLAAIAEVVGAPAGDRDRIASWRRRGIAGLQDAWDPGALLYLDRDRATDRPLRVRCVSGLAGIVAGVGPDSQTEMLWSAAFAGHPSLRHALPPSTSPDDPAFDPASYWRGPVWPVAAWLLGTGLEGDDAARLRSAGLDAVRAAGFAEYLAPGSGGALGAAEHSWTAAVTLDWLAQD